MADKKLSEEEVADLKEAFAMFDINGDGKLFRSLAAMTTKVVIDSAFFRPMVKCYENRPRSLPLVLCCRCQMPRWRYYFAFHHDSQQLLLYIMFGFPTTRLSAFLVFPRGLYSNRTLLCFFAIPES